MAIQKMRVGDWSMARRKRQAVRPEPERTPPPVEEWYKVVDHNGKKMIQGINDQGILEYTEIPPDARRTPGEYVSTTSFRTAGPCTVAIGSGVTSAQRPGYQMGYLLFQYQNKKLGYGNGSLAWILFTEPDAPTSGDKGHHVYKDRPMGGTKMADWCDKYGPEFGVWFRTPPHGRHTTGTATPLRVLAYAPPGVADVQRLVIRLRDRATTASDPEERREMNEFLEGYDVNNKW